MANGGREKAPVQNIWSSVAFLCVARSIISHEQAAPLKRFDEQAKIQIGNQAEKSWTAFEGWVLWDIYTMENAAPLKRVGKQTKIQVDNPADKSWKVLKGLG